MVGMRVISGLLDWLVYFCLANGITFILYISSFYNKYNIMLWCLNQNRIYIKSILIGISWLIYLGYTLALINNLTPNGCLSLHDLMYYNARSMQHNQSHYTIPISTTASKKIGQTSILSQRFNLAWNLFMAWVITYLIVIFQYIPLWAVLIGGFK
jgi:hypothetical protein